MNTVFVYGLLKPDFSLHRVAAPFLERAIEATVSGRLYDGGVPAARFDQAGEIRGFVFWLHSTDEALRVLDELEDEGTHYRRVTVTATTPDGPVEAYAYEYLLPLDGCPDVGGLWTKNLPR